MGWFGNDTVKITIDKELQNVIDSVINNGNANNVGDAIRYAVLHSALNKPIKNNGNGNGKAKKRESIDKRTARLTSALDSLITNNEGDGQTIEMSITAAERESLGKKSVQVKHWQLAITERVIRDITGVNQSIASKFLEQNKSKIDRHNKWLFDNCGWTPKDASAFNRRTKAAARKFKQLEL